MSRTLALTLLLGLLISPAGAGAETLAFVGATVHPVSGPPVADAVMVVQDEAIVALGGPETAVPEGARRINLTGRHLYPAFVHPGSLLGLTEIGSVRGSVDAPELGDENAALRVEASFNPDSLLLPPATSGGVLHALVVPGGTRFAGTSALMRLDGWTWEDMTVKAPVGLHLRFPQVLPSPGAAPEAAAAVKESQSKAVKEISEILARARAYGRARAAAEAGTAPAPQSDLELEALQPLLAGELPLFLHADEKTQIESALDWADGEELTNLVLVSRADAAELAPRLAEAGIPVILRGVLTLPSRSWQPYDAAFTAAARLHEAGVKLAIGDGGNRFVAANARNLPFHAAMAAAYGLPREEALAAVTLRPAEIFGVADRLGSLEPGKEATFLVTTGDPLEITTQIEASWLAGREIDRNRDPQVRLWERYRSRPRP